VIVMGVSGSGKSTVGAALAGALRWPFYDGDTFHSQANIDKMATGTPLADEDRDPWLKRLHQLIADKFAEGHSLVVACSALKEAYRLKLRGDLQNVNFVYLRGDYETIHARMQARPGHYMKPEMLQSQFADLEVPELAVVVDVRKKLEDVVGDALLGLELSV
jgi:gluconokinase